MTTFTFETSEDTLTVDLEEDTLTATLEEDTLTVDLREDTLTVTLEEDTLTAVLEESTLEVLIAEGYTFNVGKVYLWTYADSTARLAATGFTESQVGYLALQSDDNSLWMLTSHSPITWQNIGLSAGVGDMLKSVYDTDEDGIVDSMDGGSF